MEPIVLIHGYSAESKETSKDAIAAIYGTLPKALRDRYGKSALVEIDLGRYISLEDGVTIDDISRALDRALRQDYPHLLQGPMHVLVHSTGALVIRNWVRRFSPKPSPIRNLVYMAGANFGSGWAHIGKGQLAKWARLVFVGGSERGVQVLDALELGSSWTLDLHLDLLKKGATMWKDYKIFEHVIVGTQADVAWFEAPLRYAKEDGADGVVRVSASNVNFQYLRLGPTAKTAKLTWEEARRALDRHLDREGKREAFYEIKESSYPGEKGRPLVPLAIPYECAHSGDDMGVVTGKKCREQVLRTLDLALNTRTAKQWEAVEAEYSKETQSSYGLALEKEAPSWWQKWIHEPRAQYDAHAQIVFRVRDQDGRPVEHFDIFFDSDLAKNDTELPIGALFQDKHLNEKTPNCICFYLRTHAFDKDKKTWISRVPQVKGCFLEISAVEPGTGEILYLPFRLEFTSAQLERWIQPHRTTVIDVELMRLPSPELFRLVRF